MREQRAKNESGRRRASGRNSGNPRAAGPDGSAGSDLKHLKRDQLLKILRAQAEEIDRLRGAENAAGEAGTSAAGVETEETKVPGALPETAVIRREAAAERQRAGWRGAVRSTAFILTAAAAILIVVAVLLLPVLRIYGTSMQNTLSSGDVTVSVRSDRISRGDVIAFYYNNNILVKRVIAAGGDEVNIGQDGTVSVNGKRLTETYLSSRACGDIDITLPYRVPKGKYFVMGDNRETSVDSRSRSIGCVSQEQIVGKPFFRIWPLTRLGPVR